MYNGIQLTQMKDVFNFLNSVEFAYDYNKEKEEHIHSTK